MSKQRQTYYHTTRNGVNGNPLAITPLPKQEILASLGYMEWCDEDRIYGSMFRSFDDDLRAYFEKQKLEKGCHRTPFMHSFVEYVIEDVERSVCLARIPIYNVPQQLLLRRELLRTRREARRLYGKTTRHHAKIYRLEININLLEHAGHESLITYFRRNQRVRK